jgi:HlyD family secretion protein
MSPRNVLIAIVVLVAAGGFWWWQSSQGGGMGDSALQATGTLEVEEITVASQTGGRVEVIAVQRGDQVTKGQQLVSLQTTMLDADLARTEAAAAAVQAARQAAYDAWRMAQELERNPQEIELQIAEVQSQLAVVELQLQAAQQAGDPAGLALATAQRDGLQGVLEILQTMRAEPTAIRLQVSQAEMFYRSMQALEQATLSILDLLRIQRAEMTLTAPVDGYVLERLLAEGEVAAPLAPILILADIEHLTLTVYLPQDSYGRVRLGQKVEVTVDSFPDRTFVGEVSYISPRAEFTPVMVQTGEERARLVYAVEIALDNGDLALKPGMIAEARFGE